MRERTYYPQLCLVQVACEQMAVCLDPLCFDFSDIISEFLADPGMVKILHSASQDIEVLGHYCETQINPLFDTQLAAEFSGLQPQAGYAALVKQLSGVELPKSQTRSNWAKRPLSTKQIDYSINDVKYLKPIYDQLKQQLSANSRYDWFKEEQQSELERMAAFKIDPAQAYREFKASHRLDARAQQFIKSVVNWRENTAQQADKPRHWIVSDKTITELAKKMPQNMASLRSITSGDRRFNNKYLSELLTLLQQSSDLSADAIWSDGGHLSTTQKKQVNELRENISIKSRQLNIPATRLGTRRDMVEFVKTGQGRLAQGWRVQALAE